MNSHQIKISGSFEIPEPLEINTTYALGISAEITDINKSSDDAGGFIYSYKAKPIIGQASDGKKTIKFKDNKKQSWKLRYQLMAIAQDRGLDGEKFYTDTMIKLRHHTLAVLDFLEGLNEN